MFEAPCYLSLYKSMKIPVCLNKPDLANPLINKALLNSVASLEVFNYFCEELYIHTKKKVNINKLTHPFLKFVFS